LVVVRAKETLMGHASARCTALFIADADTLVQKKAEAKPKPTPKRRNPKKQPPSIAIFWKINNSHTQSKTKPRNLIMVFILQD
jgi:hypothetical protein